MAYDKLKEGHYQNLGGINVKISEYNTEDSQFLDLRNYCFYKPGALSVRPGQEYFSVSLPLSTYPVKPSTSMEYIKNSGATFVVYDVGSTLYVLPNTAVGASFSTNATTALTLDYVVQNDFLYCANGQNFAVFNGSVSVFYRSETTRFISGNATYNTALSGNGITNVIASGLYYFWVTPIRALAGQSYPTQYGLPTQGNIYPNTNGVFEGFGVAVSLSATIVSMGKWVLFGFTVPAGFGYSFATPEYQKGTSLELEPYTASILNTLKNDNIYIYNISTFGGGVTYFGIEFDHYTLSASWENQYQITMVPRFLETYNNMLFMSGFSSLPNQVLVSEIGQPERVKEENFFEIRTGDNKEITGCVFFQDSLLFFKKTSIHEVVGTSPTDLSLRLVNNQYGSLNNEGIVVFQNRLWFVDDRGICEYNAANIEIKSEPIQDYLNEIDKSRIKAIHYKDRSEVWFCAENICFVYNYFNSAWSINDVISIDRQSGAAVLPFGVSTSDPIYWVQGASYINLAKFNPTLSTDFGQAITLVAKTKFHKRMGDSTQELWRRFYLDVQSGVTLGATVNFYPDYGSSIFSTRSMTLTSFQDRIDFGISAKSLAIEFIIRSSQSITVNGYTVESRYLRSV